MKNIDIFMWGFLFFPFQGHTLGIQRSPGQGSNQSYSCRPTPQPRQILTHLSRPGIDQGSNPQPHGSQSDSFSLRHDGNSYLGFFYILICYDDLQIFVKLFFHFAAVQSLLQGVSVVVQQVKKPTSIHGDTGSIPGLTWWVKDPVMPRAVVQVADSAQIWCHCGCGVGQKLQLHFDPNLGTSICHMCGPKKNEKIK